MTNRTNSNYTASNNGGNEGSERDQGQGSQRRINYLDFLHDEVKTSFIAYNALTTPNANDALDSTYVFKYDMFLIESDLDNQATVFSRYLCSQHNFAVKYQKVIWDDTSFLSRLKDTYKYSFLKTLYLIEMVKEGGLPYAFGGSRLFYGHSYLLKTFRSRSIRYDSTSNNCELVKQLTSNYEYYEAAMDNSIGRAIIESEGFVEKFESMLANLEKTVVNIAIETLSVINNLAKAESCPLGNSCFDLEVNNLHYLSNGSSSRNFSSIYWNTACGIRLVEQSLIDDNDSVYRDIPISRVYRNRPMFEMLAITGLDGLVDISRRPGGISSNPDPNSLPSGPAGGGKNPSRTNKSKSNAPAPVSPAPSPGAPNITAFGIKSKLNELNLTRYLFKAETEFKDIKIQISRTNIPVLDSNKVYFTTAGNSMYVRTSKTGISVNPLEPVSNIAKQMQEIKESIQFLESRLTEQERSSYLIIKDLKEINDNLRSGRAITYKDVLLIQLTLNITLVDVYAINSQVFVQV